MEHGVSWQRRLVCLFLGCVVGGFLYRWTGTLSFPPEMGSGHAQMAAGITGCVAVLWFTEVLPVAATSLIPMVAFPALGVVSTQEASQAYAHPIIWMFFGGLVLALGIERWGLHRRVALHVIQRMGTSPSRLVWGFMASAGFISMWMNNTSTTLMLMPIAMAMIGNLRELGALREHDEKNFAFAVLLGVAYASSIGGMATPVGTAPNALFMTAYAKLEQAGAASMTFSQWCIIVTPMAWIFLGIAWVVLTRIVAPQGQRQNISHDVLARALGDLGVMRKSEKRMMGLFVLIALLWITRRDVDLGASIHIPGWWRLLPIPHAEFISDGMVSVFGVILSFFIPCGDQPHQTLMDWDTAKKIPWDILFLIGGGVAIAEAFDSTGLAKAAATSMQPVLSSIPLWLAIVVICTIMTILTEFTSNAASTALMLPVMASTAEALGVAPILFMMPATLAASSGFMLPIATPPNAIVFASGKVSMRHMAIAGFLLNITGIVLISATTWIFIRVLVM